MMGSTAPWRESTCTFDCCGDTLQGVLTLPATANPTPIGMVIVVGGPQYRAGSHRQFVLMARALARAGHAVLRFDVRGMGDSGGSPRSFEALDDDINAAIGVLLQVPGVQRVGLWGLCDGAAASLLYMDGRSDARVAGLALLNPWVRSEESLARTHVKHYYRQRLLQPAFWHKLLRGGVGMQALRELGANLCRLLRRSPSRMQRPFQQRMAMAWHGFNGHLLVVLSADDWTAREFEDHVAHSPEWAGARNRPRLHWLRIDSANHTFSSTQARLQAQAATQAWLASLPPH